MIQVQLYPRHLGQLNQIHTPPLPKAVKPRPKGLKVDKRLIIRYEKSFLTIIIY